MDTLNPADVITYIVVIYLAASVIVGAGLLIILPHASAFEAEPRRREYESRRNRFALYGSLMWPATLLLVLGSAIPPVRERITSYLNGGRG